MSRPEFKPTAALKRKVAIAKGGGMSNEEIALTLGICRNTLEKHFAHELSVVAYEKRFEVLESLHKKAKSGNVAACKEYLKQTPNTALEKGKGKKAQADEEAQHAAAGTDWDNLLSDTVQ